MHPTTTPSRAQTPSAHLKALREEIADWRHRPSSDGFLDIVDRYEDTCRDEKEFVAFEDDFLLANVRHSVDYGDTADEPQAAVTFYRFGYQLRHVFLIDGVKIFEFNIPGGGTVTVRSDDGLTRPHGIDRSFTPAQAANLYPRRRNPYGGHLYALPDDPPLSDDDDEELDTFSEPSTVDVLRSWLLRGDQVDQIQPLEPLVEDVLDLNTLAQMYGPPKSGKSFVALDLACHVAAGLDWHDHQTINGGTVLYVAAEGASGMRIRRRAWQLQHPDANLDRLLVMPRAVNLGSHEWAIALAQLVAEERPVLVVIDTLARSSVGIDENSTKEMGLLIEAADHLRQSASCTVLIVHHSGKDLAKGGRGNTAVLGAIDINYQVTKTDGTVSVLKEDAKDQEDGGTLRFAMTIVETDVIGRDGKRRSTCVITPAPSDQPMAPGGFRPTHLMERLSRYIELHPAVSQQQILESVQGQRSARYQALDVLISEGYVSVDKGPRGAKLHRSLREFREGPDNF